MASGNELTMSLVKTRATYEDLLAVPDHKVAEILDGELFVSPRPAGPHTRVTSVLGMEIGGPYDRGRGGPGGWWILDEPELHFGEDVLVPDIAGWRRERGPDLNAAFFTVAPDWVCETISPSTERIDRARKMRIYGREGVKHAWLLNPIARTLEVYRLEERWTLLATYAQDEKVRAEPFDAIDLELAALWPEDGPR